MQKNFALAISGRSGMVVVLCAALLVGLPVSPAHAATCTVTSALDDGSAGTLRAAIVDASCDEIDFDAGLSGATITLASTLVLAHDVSIDGSALAAQVSISGGRTGESTGVRVLSVDPGVDASLKSLIVTRGYSPTSENGGGIYNAGTLALIDSTVSDSVAGYDQTTTADYKSYGGGIYNAGVLSVTGSTISGNSIINCAYGVGMCGAGYGAGIYNANRMTVTGSTISANFADCVSGFGGGIYNAGTLTLANSTLSANSEDDYYGDGGGIFNSGLAMVTASTFTGNTNGYLGGGGGIENIGVLTVANSTFY